MHKFLFCGQPGRASLPGDESKRRADVFHHYAELSDVGMAEVERCIRC
jgi:hypothetical protein